MILLAMIKNNEVKIYGINACQALFQSRPKDIIKVYLEKTNNAVFKDLTAYCSKNRIGFNYVDSEELTKITKATHHEGVCFISRPKPSFALNEFLKITKKKNLLFFGLEGVGNPHNLGAIIRSCAHFGIDAIIILEKNLKMSGAIARTAEGGAEFVELITVNSWEECAKILGSFQFQIFATSSHAKTSLNSLKTNQNTLVIFGAEGEGLNQSTMKSFTTFQIPGTGKVESLNVSVAAAVVAYEFARLNLN
jgi:TrmH RNA methyltransferase